MRSARALQEAFNLRSTVAVLGFAVRSLGQMLEDGQLEALIEQPGRSLTMNCGYGRGFSVTEVLDAVDRVTNQTITRRLEPRRAGDPAELVSDPSRIRETLPWQPRHADLEQIIAHALQWERKLSDLRGE